ncbi:MAG TPA: hypothetical protein VF756_27480 [Thermoanaerobaculia bacterium]
MAAPVRAGFGRWTPIGPYAGSVWALTTDPANPRVFYSSTAEGIYKSADGGATWRLLRGGLPRRTGASALAVDPVRPSNAYANFGSSGLYRSADGGASWSRIGAGPGAVSVLLVDPARPETLYAGAGYGIGVLKSTNGGRSWRRADRGLLSRNGGVVHLALDPRSPSTLYASLYQSPVGIWKSTDGGATWRPKGRGLPSGEDLVFWIAVDPSSPGTVWAATDGAARKVYKSVDGGERWARTGPGGYPVAVGPSGAVYTRGARSLDGGATWTPTAVPFHRDVRNLRLVVDPASPLTVLATAPDFGISRSADGGGTWYPSNEGIAQTRIVGLAIDPADPESLYASALGVGLFRSRPGGGGWEMLNGGLPTNEQFSPEVSPLIVGPGSSLYAGMKFHTFVGLGRSTDGGLTWEELPLPEDASLVAIAVDPAAPRTVYGSTVSAAPASPACPCFQSDDGGESWKCLGLGWVKRFVVDPANPDIVYAIQRGLLKSLDRGDTWTRADAGLPEETASYDLAIDPAEPGGLYLATSQGVFKSSDGGASWSRASDGLPEEEALALAVDPRTPSTLYALLRKGVYRSVDAGQSWTSMSQGLPPNFMLWNRAHLLVNPLHPERLYVGTYSSGIYEYTVP